MAGRRTGCLRVPELCGIRVLSLMLDAPQACRKPLLDGRQSIWTDLEESALAP